MDLTTELPINQNWQDENGNHDGAISTGIGFTIAWQRGALDKAGRNGAFLLEVLAACKHQLEYYQSGKFACQENGNALHALKVCIAELESRKNRRIEAGTLGTHKPD